MGYITILSTGMGFRHFYCVLLLLTDSYNKNKYMIHYKLVSLLCRENKSYFENFNYLFYCLQRCNKRHRKEANKSMVTIRVAKTSEKYMFWIDRESPGLKRKKVLLIDCKTWR